MVSGGAAPRDFTISYYASQNTTLDSGDELLGSEIISSAAGKAVGEPIWQLPLVKEYREDIRSPIADVKNVGGPEAGTITAALFLEEFVGDARWAHLDIAGPAFAERETTLSGKGATAFGVRLLVEWLRGLSA